MLTHLVESEGLGSSPIDFDQERKSLKSTEI
mgnify:CR=1 FL=1